MSLSCIKEPGEGSRTASQTGKNPGLNNRPDFGRQKGSLITFQRLPSNPVSGKNRSLRFRE
jgi:hypothetical protein